MNTIINHCILYSILRIIEEEKIFYDPENPGEQMPVVKHHLTELVKKCPQAPTDYIIKFEGKDDNKRKFMELKSVQDIIRNYYNKYIVAPAPMPSLPPWESQVPLNTPNPMNRTRKQRKNRKQTRKQQQVKRK